MKVMGYREMDLVWDLSQASKTDKLVLLAIARRYSPGKGAWPSQKYLAKVCGVSERSVRSSIARLQELGELSWVQGSNSLGKANRYLITFVDAKTSAILEKTSAESAKTSAEIGKNFRLLNKRLNKYIYIKDSEKVLVFSDVMDSECFRVSVRFVLGFVSVGASAYTLEVMRRFQAHNVFRLAESKEQVLRNWWVWLSREFEGYSSSVEGNEGVAVTEGDK